MTWSTRSGSSSGLEVDARLVCWVEIEDGLEGDRAAVLVRIADTWVLPSGRRYGTIPARRT